MIVLRHLADFPASLAGGALTIGNFDGVHRGHAQIIARLVQRAVELGRPSVVFTFDPHPVRLLRPEHAPPPLTWTDRKAELLDELGVDAMIAYPTDEALLRLSAGEFFERIVCRTLAARALVEGSNFFFGYKREGNVEMLARLAAEAGVSLDVVEPVELEGEAVSSSRVRRLIAAGQVDQARRLLTHPYRIRGLVCHGAARGARMGFPTANVDAVDTLLPGAGVYAGLAHAAGQRWPAAINLGANPTFADERLKVEVHLIGFEGNLYGQPLEVDFLGRLRDVRKFSGIDELQRQLHDDVAAARLMVEQLTRLP